MRGGGEGGKEGGGERKREGGGRGNENTDRRPMTTHSQT